MKADQILTLYLLAVAILFLVLLVRLARFAWVNRRLRAALRGHKEEVPRLAAKLRHWPWTYDLLGIALLGSALFLAWIGAGESDQPYSSQRMAFVLVCVGGAILLYAQLARRRHKQQRQT